jgi:GT2 family glycosyltransferase
MPSSHVSIVNYRTAPLVVECLDSLSGQRDRLRGGRVVVVDNASGDDSCEAILMAIATRGWSDWVELLASPVNGGFSAGNNAAIARIRAIDPSFETVLLLNPDTLVRPNALGELVSFMASHGPCIAGGSIEDASGRRERSAHPFPSPLGELESAARLGMLSRRLAKRLSSPDHDAVGPCDWVSGAWMAISRSVLDAVGPLDDAYFLYFEEVDFCARARAAGFPRWYVPAARVMHLEGAATGVTVRRRRRPAYWFDSRRRYFVKHHGVLGLVAADLMWSLGRATLVARRALGLGGVSGVDEEPASFARDLLVGDLQALASGALFRLPRHG